MPPADPSFTEPDWSHFKGPVSQTVYCRCDAVFRSHAKMDMELRCTISKDPCPGCGLRTDARSVSGDPETQTLRGS